MNRRLGKLILRAHSVLLVIALLAAGCAGTVEQTASPGMDPDEPGYEENLLERAPKSPTTAPPVKADDEVEEDLLNRPQGKAYETETWVEESYGSAPSHEYEVADSDIKAVPKRKHSAVGGTAAPRTRIYAEAEEGEELIAPPSTAKRRRVSRAPVPVAKGSRASSAPMAQRKEKRAPRPQVDPAKQAYEGFGEVFDEVWVIQKLPKKFATTTEPMPGSGELRCMVPDPDKGGKKQVPLPLKHTAVKGQIDGYVASVTVTQSYENPYDTKIEAVYLFPLPQNSAVSDFVMTIGERRIRGIIREREEAKRIYEQARNQGYAAALLQQERPNIFTQKVANIEPGRAIDVELLYFNTLAYKDGEYEFVFPMVVGPRFNPPGFTSGIGAVPRRTTSTQPANVTYLAPNERSGHDISLSLDIDAGVSIEQISSDTHAIEVEKKGRGKARVAIRATDKLPNKDFVLRYRVAGGTVKTALMTEKTDAGGYFSLILQPPRSLEDLGRAPKELVFVLDCSGSMNGWPMELSKRAMRRALKNLNKDDTFQVIRFSNRASHFGPEPVPATAANIERAMEYVDGLRGSGGTMMVEGVKAALSFPQDPKRLRVVTFMTDGFIGNEAEILREIDKRRGAARVFSFGIGSSVNRYLMENMAKAGRGAVAYINTNQSPTEPVDRFYDVIGHPALTDVNVDWKGLEVSGVYPGRIPDLFVDRPVIITGRYKGELPQAITVNGTVAGREKSFTVEVRDNGESKKGISKIWARARIADLMNEIATRGHTLEREDELRETALAYNLVSSYTSFVAVDSTRRTRGDHGVTVQVPVPVPEGVRYDTTVK